MYIVIDPPSGWKYGFPKAVEESKWHSKDFNIREWLLAGGYPATDVDFAMQYLRVWTKDEHEVDGE